MVTLLPEMRFVTGDVESGLWCDGCQLPARLQAPVHMVTPTGVSYAGMWRRCTTGCEYPMPKADRVEE